MNIYSRVSTQLYYALATSINIMALAPLYSYLYRAGNKHIGMRHKHVLGHACAYVPGCLWPCSQVQIKIAGLMATTFSNKPNSYTTRTYRVHIRVLQYYATSSNDRAVKILNCYLAVFCWTVRVLVQNHGLGISDGRFGFFQFNGSFCRYFENWVCCCAFMKGRQVFFNFQKVLSQHPYIYIYRKYIYSHTI